jgi:A/G-specific adenine glycosylase
MNLEEHTALALKRIAEIVVTTYNGSLPSSPEMLKALPGIGTYTASALAAFAFNRPTVFIETNIRTVFIHFFFQNTKEKKRYKNPNRRSAHYHKQTPFNGSNRQLRGMILTMLTGETSMPERELVQKLKTDPKRVKNILIQLHNEGFIRKSGNNYIIA